jgi:hypothetical protein
MIAGKQRDRRVAIEVVGPRGRYLTGLVEPCGALPRKCLFIYLFIYDADGMSVLDHLTFRGEVWVA